MSWMRVALAIDSTMTSARAMLTTSQVSHGVTHYRHGAPPLHKLDTSSPLATRWRRLETPRVLQFPSGHCELTDRRVLMFALGRSDNFVLGIENDRFTSK